MRILIAGDILPTEKNEKLFEEGRAEYLFGKGVLDKFANADFKVANLEGVLTDNGQPIAKSGPSIKASVSSVNGLLPLGISAFSLANNHSLDYGMEGLMQTVKVLQKHGIPCFGYGNNISDARLPFIKLVGEYKIGVYACAESEFTIATEERGGVNPFDDLEICDDISQLCKSVDYLIVLYHGMKEQYRYPAPYVQKRCRKLIDKGADIVLCQHSHCIGCKEEYHDGTILYGQGDFMFCRAFNEYRATGLLVSIKLPEKEVEFLPVVREENRIYLAEGGQKATILDAFYKRSAEILSPGFLKKQYDEFSAALLPIYDVNSLGFWGKIIKKMRLSKLLRKNISKDNDLFQLNALRCEAHRDVYINGLRQRTQVLN